MLQEEGGFASLVNYIIAIENLVAGLLFGSKGTLDLVPWLLHFRFLRVQVGEELVPAFNAPGLLILKTDDSLKGRRLALDNLPRLLATRNLILLCYIAKLAEIRLNEHLW